VTGRRHRARRLGEQLDDVDRAALDEFEGRFGTPGFAPVVVLTAAYEEAATIGPVLDAIPQECDGRRIDRLVVVDGGTDATASVALERGAYVCVCPTNRGQGAALRLGYHLARTQGAQYVVTTDADGQYVADELPRLVEPLLRDEADFVTGSRWLGSQEPASLVRRIGSRVFARVTSALSGQHITDTSFGFRAMRADITGDLTLRQPQYQSGELLLEVLGHGYRVIEVPMTMRARRSGRSKKGSSLQFGLAYTSAVVTTWWRLRASRTSRASAARSGSAARGLSGEDHPVEQHELGDEQTAGDRHERPVDQHDRGPV
jgi:glycosyltransferase involved in cell wall biosynthesis